MEGKDGGSPAPNLPWSVAVPSVAILIYYIGDFSFSFFLLTVGWRNIALRT